MLVEHANRTPSSSRARSDEGKKDSKKQMGLTIVTFFMLAPMLSI